MQIDAGAAAKFPSEKLVRDAGMHRPRTLGRRAERPATRSASSASTGAGDRDEVGAVEGAVAVHETDDVIGCGEEPGPARGAEAAPRFVYDPGAVSMGDVCRSVG